jgi:transposase
VPDELWKLVEPLLPSEPPKPKGGRPRVPDRQVLTGILFVLKTGIPWEDLPKEMNCGSGMTCWRRLRDWQEQGVWEDIHLACLEGLQAAEGIDWRRAVLDSAAVRAVLGPKTDPNLTDWAKAGSKHHVIAEAVLLDALNLTRQCLRQAMV